MEIAAMLRHVVGAGAVVALLTGPATAQSINLLSKERQLTSEEIQREQALELQYKETVDKMPDKKKSNDPWGNVRPAPSTSAAPRQQKQ
jgi:hypothetical protein